MSLAKRFSIYSLILIFLTSACTWVVVQKVVQEQALGDYRHNAVSALKSFTHHLQPGDFGPEDRRLSGADFERFFSENIAEDHFDLVKIWGSDGSILFSTDRSLIGKNQVVDEHLKLALAGEVTTEEFRASSSDHAALGTLQTDGPYLQTYVPIVFNGQVFGVFETTCDLTPVYDRTARINIYTVGMLCGSLALLWLLLAGLVKQEAKALDAQNRDLKRLAGESAGSLGELEENYLDTLNALTAAVEARCSHSGGHARRTRFISLSIADRLGLQADQRDRLGPAATLHDIGEIGTPEAILEKTGALTTDEWEKIKEHPAVGAQIVGAVPFLAHLAPIVRAHHENFDGTGYPDGLRGERIPIEARILAVADAFDAVTSNRPYRPGVSIEEALVGLERDRGTKYDPHVVDVFIRICREDFLRHREIPSLYGYRTA